MNIQKVNVSGETAITFAAFYPFVWIKNIGANDAYAANFSGFDAGDNDVACIPAGEAVRLDAMSNVVYIKSTGTTVYAHAQNIAESPFLDNFVAGGEVAIEPLSVNTNGTYTAPTGTAYSPVTVDVQEQPWQPLEDGYSNFWFELTDDTLSPWLNFSAKNADATIDWGDGSGEVALDTLTPTHTYSKAGKYVVKVKGVTEIGQQFPSPYRGKYIAALKAAEFNADVVTLNANTFRIATGIQHIKLDSNISVVRIGAFNYCASVTEITIPNSVTAVPTNCLCNCLALTDVTIGNAVTSIDTSAFENDLCLTNITIPATVTSIGTSALKNCSSLAEIHCTPTSPPTLGTTVFNGLPSNWICYVPVGTGETYKAAAGWSAYADHILEEGQTVTRAMQRKFDALKAEETEIEEKR